MHAALLLLAFAAWLPAGLAAAQPTTDGDCRACVAASRCDTRRENCVTECRARLFSIDPKQRQCIEACGASAGQCGQAATVACRARKACP